MRRSLLQFFRTANNHGWFATPLVSILFFSTLTYGQNSTEITPDLQSTLDRQDREISELKQKIARLEEDDGTEQPASNGSSWSDRILFSGRGAVGFFSSEENGAYPNDEFRVDEARLQLEAKLHEDAYLFMEANLADRDDDREETWLGDLYVDLENISKLWNQHLPINVRAGRFDIPFGEEYQHRDAIDNALITHSLTDFWGIDEGVAVYGGTAAWDYIVAVQNGSHPFFNDYNSDKSVAARLGYNPTKAWRVSLSAMRTGDIDPVEDETSEIWYGNGFFRGIGEASTNGTFGAEIMELNLRYQWDGGHVAAATGMTWYDDDLPGDHQHESTYASLELSQDITEKWFVAGRYSFIDSDEGMPIVGLGSFGEFYSEDLVTEIWRLSIGSGYRFSRQLIAKAEYSFEQGDRLSGETIDQRDMFSAQLAFAF